MAQAVRRRPLTAEARVRSRVSPCGICVGQSGTGAGFSPSTSVFPCQFHSTGAPLLGKTKKKVIIFITRLQNKPQGCGASVVSAAGPFITKKRVEVFRLAPAVKPNSLHHPVQQQLTTTSVRPPVSHVRCAVSNKQFWQLLPAGQSEIKID